jgi:hypothetical protein
VVTTEIISCNPRKLPNDNAWQPLIQSIYPYNQRCLIWWAWQGCKLMPRALTESEYQPMKAHEKVVYLTYDTFCPYLWWALCVRISHHRIHGLWGPGGSVFFGKGPHINKVWTPGPRLIWTYEYGPSSFLKKPINLPTCVFSRLMT